MDKVYKWLEFLEDFLLGSDKHQNWVVDALMTHVEKMDTPDYEPPKEGYIPLDIPHIGVEWADWSCSEGWYGKGFNVAITRIIDFEFVKYNESTRNGVVKRIFRKIDALMSLVIEQYSGQEEHVTFPICADDKRAMFNTLKARAFDDIYWFIVDLLEVVEDYGIDCEQLNPESAKRIEEFEKCSQGTENDTSALLFKSLSKYVRGGSGMFAHALKHKEPLSGMRMKWVGKPFEAVIFANYLQISISDFNKCFYLNGDKKLERGHQTKNDPTHYDIYATLEKWAQQKASIAPTHS